jgi:dienelactone hydrolase
MKRLLFSVMLMMTSVAALAEDIEIPWKGDYLHNSNKKWSRDNPYASGFSKNFQNGAPEENGKVERDGALWADLELPKGFGDMKPPLAFMIVMHGCEGMSVLTTAWAKHVAQVLNPYGIGVLVLNSFSSRGVQRTCGIPDFHWARRRADDAYSALDYLIETGLAKPDEVYLMGQSNGGLATLIAMSQKESDHPNKFAAGFPIVPSCINTPVRADDYVRPMIIFGGEQDDANPVKYCIEMLKKKRSVPIQLVVYKDANHGFMEDYKARTVKGWTDSHGKDHYWHLSYNPAAESDMMQTIISAIKTKKFAKGVEIR